MDVDKHIEERKVIQTGKGSLLDVDRHIEERKGAEIRTLEGRLGRDENMLWK